MFGLPWMACCVAAFGVCQYFDDKAEISKNIGEKSHFSAIFTNFPKNLMH